ncbi:MAG: hypothetical protein OXC26_08740 [Albidovulum sp.]|nr:hypothetical protein [Albidovulum sp.]
MDIRTFVAFAAGLAGFHASKRQPFPGTKKFWQGLKILWYGINTVQAQRKWKKV